MKKDEALLKLQRVIDEIPKLQQVHRKSPEVEKWKRDTRVVIERVFPSHPNYVHDFDTVSYLPGSIRRADFRGRGGTSEAEFQTAYVKGLDKAKAILQSMFDEIQDYWKDESAAAMPLASDSGSMWDLIHPEIASVARTRFESEHFADAVESSLKKINSIVKAKVLEATGRELDGAGLMTTAFSVQNPIIPLDDLSTESGRNIQQGYMQIFAGAMIGIRNPKAHDNIIIDENRAIHFLFLSSLLMYKLDEKK